MSNYDGTLAVYIRDTNTVYLNVMLRWPAKLAQSYPLIVADPLVTLSCSASGSSFNPLLIRSTFQTGKLLLVVNPFAEVSIPS